MPGYCVIRSLHHPPQPQQVLKKPEFNKYEHMEPPINVLTMFEPRNQAALDQIGLDFLADGAIVVSNNGDVVASGVTVLDLAKGSVNGGKKTAAASSAAQGDGTDEATYSITAKLSEDDCQTTLAAAGGQKVTLFNGALPDGAKMGGKEGYAVLLRDPTIPAVSGEEFLRLAEGGHVAGVVAFTTAPKNKGQVDAPRHVSVRGVAWWRVVNVWCAQMMMLVCDGEGGLVGCGVRASVCTTNGAAVRTKSWRIVKYLDTLSHTGFDRGPRPCGWLLRRDGSRSSRCFWRRRPVWTCRTR